MEWPEKTFIQRMVQHRALKDAAIMAAATMAKCQFRELEVKITHGHHAHTEEALAVEVLIPTMGKLVDGDVGAIHCSHHLWQAMEGAVQPSEVLPLSC